MQQRGFTLIELIVVIVILGILAVTAAPRFIDLQSDARTSTLQGVRAALQGGSQLVYAKSAIEGEQGNAAADNASAQVTINGETVDTNFGYPDGDSMTDDMLGAFADLNTADWTLVAGSGSAATGSPASNGFGVHPNGVTPDYSVTAEDGDSCHVLYTDAADANTAPVITIVTGNC